MHIPVTQFSYPPSNFNTALCQNYSHFTA